MGADPVSYTHLLKENECIADLLLNEVRANECRTCGKCVFGYEGITQLEMTLKDVYKRQVYHSIIEPYHKRTVALVQC